MTSAPKILLRQKYTSCLQGYSAWTAIVRLKTRSAWCHGYEQQDASPLPNYLKIETEAIMPLSCRLLNAIKKPCSSRAFLFKSSRNYSWDSAFGFSRKRIPKSRSWVGSTGAGAWVNGHSAVLVFGNAITSRIEDAPVINITRRSRPNAKPPWGGAPNFNAFNKKQNIYSASS